MKSVGNKRAKVKGRKNLEAKAKKLASGMETLIDKLTEIRQVEIITLTGLKGKLVKEEWLEDVEPELMKLYKSL